MGHFYVIVVALLWYTRNVCLLFLNLGDFVNMLIFLCVTLSFFSGNLLSMDGDSDGWKEVVDSPLILSAKVQGYYSSKKPVTLMQDNRVIGEAHFLDKQEAQDAIKETEQLQKHISNQLETNKRLLGTDEHSSSIANLTKNFIGAAKRFSKNEHVCTAVLVTCTFGNFYSFVNVGSIYARANTVTAIYPYVRNWILGGLLSSTIGTMWFRNRRDCMSFLLVTALASGALGFLCG
jgi:hypothetical protein